jgi:hypothetical protein
MPSGLATLGPPPWLPLLVAEGVGRVVHAPAVFRAGRAAGRPLYGVLVVSGTAGGSGAGGVSVVFAPEPGARTAVPLATAAAVPRPLSRPFFRIAGSSSPRLGTCRSEGEAHPEGWSLSLAAGEEPDAPLVVAGYAYVTTAAADGARLYRLSAWNGDPCRLSDCCETAADLWAEERRAGDRVAFRAESLSAPFAVSGGSGALRLAVLSGAADQSPVVRELPFRDPPRVRSWRDW